MKTEIVRGNDEIAFWLRDKGIKNVAAVHIAVSIEHSGCPICHQSFLYFKALFDHFRLTHYENARHDDYLNQAYGILQEVVAFFANTHHTKVGKDMKATAVYRLIKDFGLPTGLVAAMFHTTYTRISIYYADAMPKEGWLVKVIGGN
jgi:hypothetical protein